MARGSQSSLLPACSAHRERTFAVHTLAVRAANRAEEPDIVSDANELNSLVDPAVCLFGIGRHEARGNTSGISLREHQANGLLDAGVLSLTEQAHTCGEVVRS